jgi:hypothetical protein
VITAADVRSVAAPLPRAEKHLIRDHVKFPVGRIVYVSISPDETTMGFGFPREERAALIAAEPGTFALPRLSDQRFSWVHARMARSARTRCANWSSTRGGRAEEDLSRVPGLGRVQLLHSCAVSAVPAAEPAQDREETPGLRAAPPLVRPGGTRVTRYAPVSMKRRALRSCRRTGRIAGKERDAR